MPLLKIKSLDRFCDHVAVCPMRWKTATSDTMRSPQVFYEAAQEAGTPSLRRDKAGLLQPPCGVGCHIEPATTDLLDVLDPSGDRHGLLKPGIFAVTSCLRPGTSETQARRRPPTRNLDRLRKNLKRDVSMDTGQQMSPKRALGFTPGGLRRDTLQA